MTNLYQITTQATKTIQRLLEMGYQEDTIYYVIMRDYGLGKRKVDDIIETIIKAQKAELEKLASDDKKEEGEKNEADKPGSVQDSTDKE